MKIVLSAAVLGSALAPAFSLSYLDSLNGANPATAPTGAGITSYLDALPAQPTTSGAGISSYTDALNGGPGGSTPAPFSPPAAPVAPVAQAAPVTPAAPVDSFVSSPPSGPGLGS